MNAKELIENNSLANFEVAGGQTVVFTEIAMTAINMAREEGAKWQAEQSPWISVTEQLPNEDEIVLCRMKSNGAIVSGYIFISPEGYVCVSTSPDFEFEDYGGYECDMWMPIPKIIV